MAYTVGVSAGIFGAAQQEEKSQYAGLVRKAEYAITKGVRFVQIDLESISEFQEQDIVSKMKRIREQLGIRFGLHSENVAFGSREFPHLDSAIYQDYRRGHERLMIIFEDAGKIGFEYVLAHSSESVPFIFLGRELQPTDLVDPWGNPLGEFIQKFESTFKELGVYKHDEGWIWKQDEIWRDLLHDTIEGFLKREDVVRRQGIEELSRRNFLEHKIRDKKIEILNAQGIPRESITEEQLKNTPFNPEEIELVEEEKNRINEEVEVLFKKGEEDFEYKRLKDLWEYFLRLIQSRTLSYGPERIAYYIIGKWMQEKNDPLWMPLIDISIKYYAKKEQKSPEQWLKDKGIKDKRLEDNIFAKFYQLWVPSVSAKYVWGHFNPDTNPKSPISAGNAVSGLVERDPKKFLDKYKMDFILETPMASPGMEDLLRFPQPAQMYYLMKEMKSDRFGIALDIEHMLMDGLNVEVAIDILPSDAGRLVRVIHTGWPSPLGPAHIPIPLGSEQQLYLYKTYWELRKKGMGRDQRDNTFIIFERGGGGDPIQQSVLALRVIKEFLEKDTAPERLPMEFWGLQTGQWASIDRQLATIKEHAWDPLKGLLQMPEEEHGIYSKSAIEKGKGEEWKKEKFR